jgi:hypothetical protein
MKPYPLPNTPAEWLQEIVVAIADARETKAFGKLIGHRITEADLFHLAPLVCLKYRGRPQKGNEADRVTETALANFVGNADPDGINHDLEKRPFMAFALCYLASHLCLDLIEEQKCEAILNCCEENWEDE